MAVEKLHVFPDTASLCIKVSDHEPLLVNRSAALIAAVVQNEVNSLKYFSNCTDWYKIDNSEDGNSLLQIGIMHQKKEVCDYLLSLPDFPLDHENNDHLTALALALRGNGEFCDHISYELIKRGASVNTVSLEDGVTLLHHSLNKSLVKVSKLLMERGYDVNALTSKQLSPLCCCLDSSSIDEIKAELVAALLYYGADPTIGTIFGFSTFEFAVKFSSFSVEEALFYYTFDQYTCIDIHFEVLLTLANKRSPFFHETVQRTNNVILGNSPVNYYHLLFLIDVEYLDVLIKKCGYAIAQIFGQGEIIIYPKMSSFYEPTFLRNLDFLVGSDLRHDTINFIVMFSHIFYSYFILAFKYGECTIVENVYYLLSYGLRLNESHLEAFCNRYGYGELLKIALHMDIVQIECKEYITNSLFVLLYDVNMTLEKYLQDSSPYYPPQHLWLLLPYFVDWKLHLLCQHEGIVKADVWLSRPRVPLLVELARNVFRSYFIETFNIKSAKQFYALINGLPVSPVHKKIITYETELY
ncbi:hypothetical protein Zmor_024456 [Zophobas morio]|uniref:Uncharacterized protein n=1 Tax=Zophobas morio TaxID=2755281 RepID=A0AA38I099_9CUCU|nr:hypothetical protein Zmor_024456 [Zophobas morio]